ncbi:hypothetical protein C8R47DRAFT_1178712 [Mycena vitilis]|nr:hypothetical protein C8R47DRAFT_1178712 [Mycena vitilis]
MPLDGHSYLVSQGWTGSGTGLRQGAISRPLAIPQKKNLAGLGKERDEAFPFWDHLFSAASKAIQIKISNDDSDNSDSEPNATVSLKRTSTGILSNRRPVTGAMPADSGATTPDVDDGSPRLSLLATAKREAAKRVLYSRFFRGPVLGPDLPAAREPTVVVVQEVVQVSAAENVDTVDEKPRKKKRKLQDREEEERRERKRLRKEEKELKREKKKSEKSRGKEREKEDNDAVTSSDAKKEKKRKRKQEAADTVDVGGAVDDSTLKQAAEKGSEQSDKRKRKEERRKAKESSKAAEGEPKKKRKRPVE